MLRSVQARQGVSDAPSGQVAVTNGTLRQWEPLPDAGGGFPIENAAAIVICAGARDLLLDKACTSLSRLGGTMRDADASV